MNPNAREPVPYNTDDAKRMSQVGFLVEARSRSGYSGSPVFTLTQHAINNPRAVLPWVDMRIRGRFWKDFYQSMLTHTMSSAMRKLLMGILAPSLIGRAHGSPPSVHTEMVIAVDLTKSVDVKGPDGTTEFQKNINAVAGVLQQVTPDTRVTIVGITDRSFAQPYTLLTATVPAGQDYFGTKLSSARHKLVAAWRQRSSTLMPTYIDTDIMGIFELTRENYAQLNTPNAHRILIIFSDMRQHTPALDLESTWGLASAAQRSSASEPHPDIVGADLYVLGVDGVGEPMGRWYVRKQLWDRYFRRIGGRERQYSSIRVVNLSANR